VEAGVMGVFSFFKRNSASIQPSWYCSLHDDGICFHRERKDHSHELLQISFTGFLTQLKDDDLVIDGVEGDHVMSWDLFYNALGLPGYAEMPEALSLPAFTVASPVLSSRNALSDSDFSISKVSGCSVDPLGETRAHDTSPVGSFQTSTVLCSSI
jgi:hypothetical protein